MWRMVEEANAHSPKVSQPDSTHNGLMDRIVYEWLLDVRKKNGVVSGLQLKVAVDVLADDICDFDYITHGRAISFTTSRRSRMTQDYDVAYCSLKSEAGSVDKDAIKERMNQIRNICSDFESDDIYNCDETGMYLRLPVHYGGARERCQTRAGSHEPSVDSLLCQSHWIFACPSSIGSGSETACPRYMLKHAALFL